MNSDYEVKELVPHSGLMSLLSRIVAYGEEWLIAEVDITEKSVFFSGDGVPAWIGMEYMAQAIGAYSGLQERVKGESPKLGFLLGTRNYSSKVSQFSNNAVLTIKVEREMQGDNGLSAFQCSISAESLLAEASLNVYQPENAEEFLKDAI